MSLETDVRTAVDDIKGARDGISADAATLHAIAHGPATGTSSLVATEGGSIKTAARAIAEMTDGAAFAAKDFANVTGILAKAHGGSGSADFDGAVATAMASSFGALAHGDRLANGQQARADLGIDIVARSATQAAPPVSPATGDAYLIPAGASGAWAAQVGKVAFWATPTAGVWNYRTPDLGWSVWATDTNTFWEYDFDGWTAALGSGSGGSPAYAGIDARIVKVAKTNRGGGCKVLATATADGRILLWGDNAVFPFNPVGIRGSAYELPVPWDSATVSIEELYLGRNYLLVQTSEANGNLYAIGANDHGQCGDGTTTAVTTLKRIQKFADDGVKITKVFTEATHGAGSEQAFWFAVTSGAANLYSCGSGVNYTQGNNATADVTTPRRVTTSGGTPLAGIDAVSCSTVSGPVFARTTGNAAFAWGAGTDGAHGLNTTSAASWPATIETSVGSGVARTDIAQIVTTSSAVSATRAVTWMRTASGGVVVAGSRAYGNGDGGAVGSSASLTFQPIAGTLASLAVAALFAGGGEFSNCLAITAAGQGYICGIMDKALRGDGVTTSLHTFALLSNLPAGFAGALTGAVIAGGGNNTTIYLEAEISGVKTVASIGYDASYQTAKGTTGVAASAQTWGVVKGARGTLAAWGVFGNGQVETFWQLNTDSELRAAGGNDQGQAGATPGQTTSIDVLQPVRTGLPRLLKGPTPHADTSWQATTTYTLNDLVPYQGSVWRCRVPTSLAVAPPSLPTTLNSDWQCWGQKGDGAGGGGGSSAWADITGKPTTLAGYGITDAQPLDADLTAIAALTTTTFGRLLLTAADAAGLRSSAGLAPVASTGAYSDLTGLPAIPSPGGSAGQVQFKSGSTFAGDSGLVYDATGGVLAIGGKTVATSTPMTFSQTWNGDASVVFKGESSVFVAPDANCHVYSSLWQVGSSGSSNALKNGYLKVLRGGEIVISDNDNLGAAGASLGGIARRGAAGEMALTSLLDPASGMPADVFRFYWEDSTKVGSAAGSAAILRFMGTNRGSLESGGALNFISNVGRFEHEGLGSARLHNVGYEAGSSHGRTIDFNNSGQDTKAVPVSASTVDHTIAAMQFGYFDGSAWTVQSYIDGYGRFNGPAIDLAEQASPGNPAADTARLYAKDVAGVTKLAFRDSAGTETVLGSGGGSSAWADITGKPTTIAGYGITDAYTKAETDGLFAANDALLFKGAINCSANPNYPAADAGHTFRVSAAGKIGGASGTNVEIYDLLMCVTDGSAAGTQAGVGANWVIIQGNIDGAVIGPASVTDGNIAIFDGATGKLLKGTGNGKVSGTLTATSTIYGQNSISIGDGNNLNGVGLFRGGTGKLQLWDNAGNTAGSMFIFGNSVSANPALKKNSAGLEARLGDDSGYTTMRAKLIAEPGTAPATASDTGTAGEIRWDASYAYICTAANTWRRVAHVTW